MQWKRGGDGEPNPWGFKLVPRRPDSAPRGSLVLVHGLFLYGICFLPLAKRLAHDGYDVYLIDYPTRRFGIRQHGEFFGRVLDAIAGEIGFVPDRSLHIVTHSLGGIVTRVALSALESSTDGRFKSLKPSMIGRIAMLAPPNKGSDAARFVCSVLGSWAGRFAKPIPELSSAPGSEIHSIPAPRSFEIGIVAGAYDMQVAATYTELESASARKILLSDHILMPFYPHVYKEVLAFLETGSFRK